MTAFDEMSSFVRVVEAGSISKAAEQLGMAKSGVSRRLADLESRLGVRLLNRTTRRSSLTDAGRTYYEGAVKLLSDVAELDAVVADSEASLKGRLRLAAPLSFGLCHLTPAIEEFMKAHPEVMIDLDFSDRQVDLVAQGIDLAVRIAELRDSSLKARRICPIRFMLCASPAYLEHHGTPRTPEGLAKHHVLHYDIGGGPVLRLADGRGGEQQLHVKPQLVANNGDFLCDMAIAGHGIILTPTFIAWQAVAMGELMPLMRDWWPPPLNAYAVYPQTRYLSRRARGFIDFLAERFGENPYWDQ
ncbi:MAG: LysR family transcriptional regulator [Xanthomonadales bacterium]|jgi:DNA-binding transcriptional LysR family regulator|nr:LysR family transcriptional regulator [Xanthomonadales bacterium]